MRFASVDAILTEPVVLTTGFLNTENYPTTIMIAKGAYTPEEGYESLDMSMPSYKVGKDDLLSGSSLKMEDVVPLSPEKEAERAAKEAANYKVQAAKKVAQEAKRATKQAAYEAKQIANEKARDSQPGAAEKKARAVKSAAAREAKREQAGEDDEEKSSVVDNMKRMYGR